ncbi:MAG: AAA family ATPase [Kofleriaceae bacterium]
MTKPRTSKVAATEPANELALAIGPRVVELLELAYRARRPILLEGPSGVGKSQIVEEFARASGLAFTVLDLSLLEPPDLVGLPVIADGKTHYASPAELPTSGRGVLMLEELNRAEVPVMQPALQLLSARKLHAYELPPGWICVAAINPEEGDYQVNRLDPALRSRFLQLAVCADREAWLEWAARANVHPVITRVVHDHDDAFEHASPRSWTYASDILHALGGDESKDMIRVAMRGYLPSAWALIVADALAKTSAMPRVTLDDDLARAVKGARADAVAMVASQIRRALASPEFPARGWSLAQLEKYLAPLPGDLREQCLETAAESRAAPALLGHAADQIVTHYIDSPLQREVGKWRKDLVVYKLRLVVATVAQWLERQTRLDPAVAPHLEALAKDTGPVGERLARWMRAHA